MSKKLKTNIGFVMNWPEHVGLMNKRVHQAYNECALLIHKTGKQAYIFYPHSTSEGCKELPIIMRQIRGVNPFRFIRNLQFLKSLNIDTLVFVDPKKIHVANFIYKLFGIKTVCYMHYGDTFSFNNLTWKQKIKKYLSKCRMFSHSQYLIINEETIDYLDRYLGIDKKRCSLVINGIDEKDFLNQPSALDEELLVKLRTFDHVILSIGQMRPDKNTQAILDTAKEVVPSFTNAAFVHVGDGQLMEYSKRFIADHELQENVFLVGKSNNVLPYMLNADLMIHGSVTEAFGYVLTEAMLSGLPIIAMKSPGAKQQLTGISPYLCEDQNELSRQTMLFLSSPKDFKYDIDAARKRARDFTLNKQGKRLYELLIK